MGKFNSVTFSASQKKERKGESQRELAECADVASLEHPEMRAGSVSAE